VVARTGWNQSGGGEIVLNHEGPSSVRCVSSEKPDKGKEIPPLIRREGGRVRDSGEKKKRCGRTLQDKGKVLKEGEGRGIYPRGRGKGAWFFFF